MGLVSRLLEFESVLQVYEGTLEAGKWTSDKDDREQQQEGIVYMIIREKAQRQRKLEQKFNSFLR